MPLGKSRIRHLADLARLKLSDTEMDRLGTQLESVMDHFNCLRDIDTAAIGPGVEGQTDSRLRPDRIVPSLQGSEALANGPLHDGEFFHVPGVIRR